MKQGRLNYTQVVWEITRLLQDAGFATRSMVCVALINKYEVIQAGVLTWGKRLFFEKWGIATSQGTVADVGLNSKKPHFSLTCKAEMRLFAGRT